MSSLLWKSGEIWKIVFLVLSLPEQGMDLHTIRAPGHIPPPHPSPEIKQAVTKRGNLWALNNSRDFQCPAPFFCCCPLGESTPCHTQGAWERGSLSWDTQTLHIFLSSILPPGHLSLLYKHLPSQPALSMLCFPCLAHTPLPSCAILQPPSRALHFNRRWELGIWL